VIFFLGNNQTKVVAAIQPAEPPPTITISFTLKLQCNIL